MKIHLLTQKINSICPIEGLTDDGTIWFAPDATDEQKNQAWEIYDSWIDPPEPDVTGFVFALSANQLISDWYESLPKIINDQLAIYLNSQEIEKLVLVFNNLTIDDTVKTEINTLAGQFDIPLNL